MNRIILFLSFVFLLGCEGENTFLDNPEDSNNSSSIDPNDPSCSGMNLQSCEVFKLVNDVRIRNGVSALLVSQDCVDLAQDHATDMDENNYFSHDSPDETWKQRFNRYGIRGKRGENIANSDSDPEGALSVWMRSRTHRRNILNARYMSTGVGYSNGKWVQCFSGR